MVDGKERLKSNRSGRVLEWAGQRRPRTIGKRDYIKPYPKEFREQVVKTAQASGHRPPEITEEFGISPDSVLRWMRQADLDAGRRQDGLTTSERMELAKL